MTKLEILFENVELLKLLAKKYVQEKGLINKTPTILYADSITDKIYNILGDTNTDELLKEYEEANKWN